MILTQGAGKDRPVGKVVSLADGVAVLAETLNQIPAEREGWWSPHQWEGNRRATASWLGCDSLAIDVDYQELRYNEKEKKEVPTHVDRPGDDAKLDTLLSLGLFPGNAYHLTPRGFRLLYVLAERITNAEQFDSLVSAVALEVRQALVNTNLQGYELDEAALKDRARFLYSPRAIVNDRPRDYPVHVFRTEPYGLHPEPEAEVLELVTSGTSTINAAAARYREDHPEDFPPGRGTCPICQHNGCWGQLSPRRWSCFSSGHPVNAGRKGTGCYTGDILDIHAAKAGQSTTDYLRAQGYLDPVSHGHVTPNPVIALDTAPSGVLRSNSYASICDVLRSPYSRNTVLGRGALEYNAQSMMPCLDRREIPEEQVSRIREMCERALSQGEGKGLKFSRGDVQEAIMQVAKESTFHPVVDWLNGLRWDGTPRLARVPKEVLRIENPHALVNTLLRKWAISAVARAMDPGCKVDTVLILVGPQGTQKSGFFEKLGGKWFSDTAMRIGDKDAYIQIQRAWIIEWAELESLQRARQAAAKGFITSRTDHFRPPYSREIKEFKRPSVFVGSTNERDFLSDPTGHRRFWTIEVSRLINLPLLAEWRDQFWAEALAAYLAGEPWYLNAEEEQHLREIQSEFTQADVWTEVLSRELADKTSATMSEVLAAVGKTPAQSTREDENRAATVLRGLGWQRQKNCWVKI